MSKILVVQPYRMLQQAIGLCLFPQHQARMTSSVPEVTEIEEVDAAIIDAAALRETDAVSHAALRSIQSWAIPIVWIDTGDAPPTPSDRVVVIRPPITKQNLERALDHCLGGPQEARPLAAQKEPSSAHTASSNVIDLVEVVEVAESAPKNREDNREPKQL